FMPFGEEAFIGVGNRSAGHGYTYGDSTRQKFTGYERDEESNLDFAQARYYNSRFGRFSSADDFLNDTQLFDSQSWNLYVYVLNNPLRFIDPDGQIKKDKDGNVIFDKKDDVNVMFYTQRILDNKGKQIGTLFITWKAERGNIYADDGTKIEAFKNGKMEAKAVDNKGNELTAETKAVQADLAKLETAGYNNTTDCHGNTFADGQVWINNDQVEKLLKGDGYDLKNPASPPQRGDVGIYTKDGNLKNTIHSVLVNTVDSKTNAVVDVISKGGITPKVTTAPGPGKDTGWNDPNVKLQYYTKRTNPSKP
ncbi:MAG: RHS repeat-associated core domain-containing protein, partial [Pyrinomonadaceae bacterium]